MHVVRTDGTHDLALARGSGGTWSPDGRWLAFSYGRLGRLAVIRADGTHFRTVDPANGAIAPAWAPDGTLGYETNGGIWTESADGRIRHRIVDVGKTTAMSALWWAPNGLLAYTTAVDYGSGSTRVWVIREDGTRRRQVSEEDPGGDETGRPVDVLRWAPDSRSLVYRVLEESGG